MSLPSFLEASSASPVPSGWSPTPHLAFKPFMMEPCSTLSLLSLLPLDPFSGPPSGLGLDDGPLWEA